MPGSLTTVTSARRDTSPAPDRGELRPVTRSGPAHLAPASPPTILPIRSLNGPASAWALPDIGKLHLVKLAERACCRGRMGPATWRLTNSARPAVHLARTARLPAARSDRQEPHIA
jgi:hypothetical protein